MPLKAAPEGMGAFGTREEMSMRSMVARMVQIIAGDATRKRPAFGTEKPAAAFPSRLCEGMMKGWSTGERSLVGLLHSKSFTCSWQQLLLLSLSLSLPLMLLWFLRGREREHPTSSVLLAPYPYIVLTAIICILSEDLLLCRHSAQCNDDVSRPFIAFPNTWHCAKE